MEYLVDSAGDRLQPMGWGVAAAFRAHYLRRTFEHILEVTGGEDPAATREFWRKYSIMDAVDNITVAWEGLRQATMNSVWRSFGPSVSGSRARQQITSPASKGTLWPWPRV